MSTVQLGKCVRIALFLGSLLAYPLIIEATAQAQSAPKPQGSPDKAAEIKILLKERQETLKKVVDALVAQYQAGIVDFQSVFHAERDLLRATLDLDDSPETRMAALREQLKMAENFAKLAEARFERGGVTQVDVLRAKAGVLEARIELVREELKAKPSK